MQFKEREVELQRSPQINTLTALLVVQIDRNEVLEAENVLLETQQRQLLQIVQQMRQQSGMKKPNDDSTFESDPIDRGLLSKIKGLEEAVAEKDNSLQRMRKYYTEVIQKIQAQHEEDKTSNKQQELVIKYNAQIQRLTQILMQREEKYGQKENQVQKCKLENTEIKLLYQKIIKQNQDNYSREIHSLLQRQSQEIQEIEKNYQIKVSTLKSECIREAQSYFNLEKQKQMKQIQNNQKNNNKLKEQIRICKQKMTEQCDLILNFEEQLVNNKKQIISLNENVKKYKETIVDKIKIIQQLQAQLINLKMQKQQQLQQIKQSQHKISQLQASQIRLIAQNKKIQTTLRKTLSQNTSLLTKYSTLQSDYKGIILDLESKCQSLSRLQTKYTRQSTQKQTALAQYKKQIRKQQQSIALAQQKKYEAECKLKASEQARKKTVQQFNKELSEINRINNQLSQQNKRIKSDVHKFDERVKSMVFTLEQANEQLGNDNSQLKQKLNAACTQKETFRKLYESVKQEHLKLQEAFNKLQQKNVFLTTAADNYSQQIQYLKEQINKTILSTSQQQQFQHLKQNYNELKIKLSYSQENISKLSLQKTELSNDIITLHEENEQLKTSMSRVTNQLQSLKDNKNSLEQKLRETQSQLSERNRHIENELPYMNSVIEEKKMLSVELLKANNENKRKNQLLELAKRSRAEEVVNLQKEVEQTRKRQSSIENELKNAKEGIERLNREKVASMRNVSQLEDIVQSIQKQNAFLKSQMKKLQSAFEMSQEQMQLAYSLLNKEQ